MKTQRKLLFAASLGIALALGGCWLDGDDDTPAATGSTAVPDSAGTSSAAFVGYLGSLGGADETTEPLAIGAGFAVPPDDTAEPQPLT